jgi:hypothetical protein
MSAVDELVFILQDAFAAKGIEETGESQSMLGNLAPCLRASGRRCRPPVSDRSRRSCYTSAGVW